MALKYDFLPPEDVSDLDAAVETLTEDEAREVFDHLARRRLGMSGEEFLRRWDAGEFMDDPERPGLMEVVLAFPFVGR